MFFFCRDFFVLLFCNSLLSQLSVPARIISLKYLPLTCVYLYDCSKNQVVVSQQIKIGRISELMSQEPLKLFHSQDLIGNSPYCLLYSSYDSLENLVLGQFIIPN